MQLGSENRDLPEKEQSKSGDGFLQEVLEKLRARIRQLNSSLEEGAREVEEMHEYYWENYSEMDQYGYENFDNQQALFQQMHANEEQLKLKRRFRKMLDSPYFGRVDFIYEGEEEAERFYIGIGNFSEKTGSVPLIFDWRAPVSSLFYDYDQGPASYQAPGGEMSGELVSRWQYKIRGGKLIYGFESDLKIDDEILMAELGAGGEVRLKNIVRTIQREQNAIIRNTKDRILVIQGAAGSGKTSVALHRIAYLLYHNRNKLKSSNVLVLSPNSVFSDYISHILPELGEENIREMSFDLFAYRELRGIAADCEDRYDQIERCLADPGEQENCRNKQSEDFVEALDYYALTLEEELVEFTDLSVRGYSMDSGQMIRLFYGKFLDIPLLSRMEAVQERFVDEWETLRGSDLTEEELAGLKEKFAAMYETRDVYTIYNRFLKQQGMDSLPDVPAEQRKLRYEDVYPVLYLKYRLFGNSGRKEIRHLVVDEMQDYSFLQYTILDKLFPCGMTILGDKAQTIEEQEQDVTAFLPGIFGKQMRKIVMNKSYRNTVEIAEYANRTAGISGIELVERHGAPVEEKSFSDWEEALEAALPWLAEQENYETAAVIAATEEEAACAASWLKARLGNSGFDLENRFSYLDRDSTVFRKGVTVTSFYLAKGLEFDRVIGIFDSGKTEGLYRQARYICATRALHELHMYEYGEKGEEETR